MVLAFAVAEGAQAASQRALDGPDFWAGLWGDEDSQAEEGDFWAGLWGEDGDETPPASPVPTAKPQEGRLYKI